MDINEKISLDIFEYSLHPVVLLNREGEVIQVNLSFNEYFKISKRKIIGSILNKTVFFSKLDFESLRIYLTENGKFSFELDLICENGRLQKSLIDAGLLNISDTDIILLEIIIPTNYKKIEKRIPENRKLQDRSMEHRPCVLYIDDIEYNRDIFKFYLEDFDIEIIELDSAKKCLDYLEERLPDLMITDIQMPEMNGIELLQSIRRKYSSEVLPIIALTAHSDSVKDEMVNNLFDDIISKPIFANELVDTLSKYIKLIEKQF